MLGIRRVKGCQIDLWVGDKADFASDQHFDSVSQLNEVALVLVAGKHVTITVLQDSLACVVRVLEDRTSFAPRRVTLICDALSRYEKLQQELLNCR